MFKYRLNDFFTEDLKRNGIKNVDITQNTPALACIMFNVRHGRFSPAGGADSFC
jgi:hypothetical protein